VLALAATWLLLFPIQAYARSEALELTLLSPAKVEAEPRRMLTVSFRVKNLSGAPVEAGAEVRLPPGWQLVGAPELGTLAPHEARTGFATVSIPVEAAAGGYEIVVEAWASGGPVPSATARVTVAVLPFARIVLRRGRLQETTIVAGESYEVSFTVGNHGNAAAAVSLELESRPEWRTEVQPARMELAPGETATVSVAVETPADLYSTVRHRITLTARAPGMKGDERDARASVSTQVIPRRRRPGSMYASLDGSLRLSADCRSDGGTSAQFELGLEGKLGATAYGRLELVGPVLLGDSGAFGQQQRALVAYEDTERGFLRLGDTSFDLGAPLISRSLPGRGVDLALLAGGTEFRAFFNRGRFGRDSEGLQLSHRWNEDGVVRATALRTREASLPGGSRVDGRTTLYSLFGQYSPFPGAGIEAEVAGSGADLGGGGGNSFRLAANYRRRLFSLDGEIVRAEPDFAGAWQDTSFQRFSLSLNPLPDFRLWAYWNRTQRNLARDRTRPAPEDRSLAVGATVNLGRNANLRVSRRDTRREELTQRTFKEHGVTMDYQLAARFDRLHTTLSWQERRQTDELTGAVEKVDRLRLGASMSLGPRASIRADFTREHSRGGAAGATERQDQLSLQADWQLRDGLNLGLGYQRTRRNLFGASSWMDGTLAWEMPRGRRLELSFRRRSGVFGGETAVGLEFMIPLSVSLPMLPQSGSAEGWLYLPGEPPEPLPGVRISIDGMEVVTDEGGRFAFPSLAPGGHELSVSRTSLGAELVPAIPLPLAFTTEPGVVARLEVPFIRAATVSGRVLRITEEYGRRGRETVAFAGVLLELRQEEETIYRVTDSGGRFTFTGVPPGRWVLGLWGGAVPAYHEVEPAEHVLNLVGGETLTGINFTVAPLEREIEVTTELD